MRATALAAALAILLTGCMGPASVQENGDRTSTTAPPPARDARGVPAWERGRWWQVRVEASFAASEGLVAKVVVAAKEPAGYAVGTDALNLSLLDRYFDHVYVGPVDAELNPRVKGASVRLFQWPLEPNATWTTPFPTANVEEGRTELTNATLTVTALDDHPATDRVRIVGTSRRNEAIDYDFDHATGWMTYLRITNASTGKILFSLDVLDAGTGYSGDVHRLLLTTLKERFAILPPCDDKARCYPEAVAIPPLEPVTVPKGFTWVDEIAFLFTFPIIVGGGTASFQFVRPDGKIDQDTHKGAGDRFEYTFRRYEARGATDGTWGVGLEVAGTAGAFVGLYGVKDEVTRL